MIENLGKLGLKVPKFFTNSFKQLQIDNDDKKDDKQ
ncbi:hypothetical protein [Lysinibacillus sp. FSL K6-3209]